MKKRLLLGLLLLLISILLGCVNNQNILFNKYLDQLLIEYYKDDPLSINFSLRYPNNFNLENEVVTAIDINNNENNYIYLDEVINNLKLFDYEKLTKENKQNYKVIMDYYQTQKEFKDFYYYKTYFGSYLGYQAQLPIILSEYHFYTKKDIEDYFRYIYTTKESFNNLLNFEKEKKEKGMGLANFIIDKVIAQCNEFIKQDSNYLIPVFNNKIDSLAYLTQREKDSYKTRNKEYINSYLIPAYFYLLNNIDQLKDNDKVEGLYYIERGKDYYQYLFKKETSSNYTVENAYSYLQKRLKRNIIDISNIYHNNLDIYDYLLTLNFFKDLSYEEVFEEFKILSLTDFPNIDDNIITSIKEIDPSLESFSSPAMYFLSPIDESTEEVIYINKKYLSKDRNSSVLTIAHEGIPGHLLQNVYLKNTSLPNIRKVLNYNGYSEGWASYVENYVLKYIDLKVNDENLRKDIINFYLLNNQLTNIIICISDIGINYYGWTYANFSSYIKYYFDIKDEAINNLYQQLIELPTNVLGYYFSCFLLEDLKNEYLDKYPSSTDLDFHNFYLGFGPSPFYILKEEM